MKTPPQLSATQITPDSPGSPGSPATLLGLLDSLGDMMRLRILHLIDRHELGVAQLCEILQSPQSTVSRHLKLLVEHQWCAARKNGTANLYRLLEDELSTTARQLWHVTQKQIAHTPAIKQDQLRLAEQLHQQQTQAQHFFSGAAGQWDQLRSALYGSDFNSAAQLALLPSHWCIADLGCGTGLLTQQLCPYVKQVIGIDQSGPMLKAAGKRTRHFDNVILKQGNLEALPLQDNHVDAALLSIVLTYVPDPPAALREAARILKPGGKLVIVDLLAHDREDFRRQMGQHWPGFEPTHLQKLLKDCHFKAIHINPLPPQPQAQGPALLLAVAHKQTP